ncbi:FAD-binding domain-containing protein [Cucurbitaria berberidis CBS 394.84]|uniref:FAD-binding domain-containing protein n=1 Tax=Cucurbitaria berberidis CBS 394.84 TaxID=1168544 RepID=A0A9P4GKK4_9PLEO|nr:FAD-binding domain-containing protein [Cucurbitaria berberidis CBS 394.84]KAF1847051.1 FAD-binding domain-containing protein [Cucurbitaria berberidis CBS 394.84]
MASSEWSPLLDEKPMHIDGLESNEEVSACRRRKACGRPSFSVRVLLLSLLCGSALYGAYVYCTRQRSQHLPSDTFDQTPVKETVAISNYTCVPGQSCWPSSSEWSTFNQTINGNLRLTVPWAAPCYSNSSSEECQEVALNYTNAISRTQQYGAMEFLNWETCGESQCFLNSYKPSSPVSETCSLGRLSTYYVQARTADDISKTLDFVREHGIRVSIKNTGHDYFGRSNAANSLAIWTHNMKDTKYHKTFQPQGCKTRYENIGEVGAGIQAQEAWKFFEPLGMLVTVGAVGSVGIAGGFGQGGGHGPLGPAYGLMVDQAVEFEVVTADGEKRTINECSDPDLFWAMRGGGGGNYAVLTSYKFQLHPAVPLNVHCFQAYFPPPEGKLDITESKVHRDIIRALAANQTVFGNHGIAGYNFLHKDHMVSLQFMPSRDTAALKAITSQWHDFLVDYPGLNITENTYHTFTTFSKWHKFTEMPAIARNGPVGLGIMEASRFIPKDLFTSPENIEQVVDAVVMAMQFSYTNQGGGSAQIYATGPLNHPDNSKTGVNPAFRDALWHVVMGAAWMTDTLPHVRAQIQNAISASVQPFKALTPGGGCYMNEGDWMEDNWQQTFFGENYDRLLEVKRRYDPTDLFNCWKCVGWTGYNDPMYSCYTQSRSDPQPTVPLEPVG